MDYCFDIDGTICDNTNGQYEAARPRTHVIQRVNDLYDDGHRIIFFTARGATTGLDWRELTERQLREWNVKHHDLIMGKPHADLYVDDKSVHPVDWLNGRPTPSEASLNR